MCSDRTEDWRKIDILGWRLGKRDSEAAEIPAETPSGAKRDKMPRREFHPSFTTQSIQTSNTTSLPDKYSFAAALLQILKYECTVSGHNWSPLLDLFLKVHGRVLAVDFYRTISYDVFGASLSAHQKSIPAGLHMPLYQPLHAAVYPSASFIEIPKKLHI